MGILSKIYKGFGRNNAIQRDETITNLLEQLPVGFKILDIGAGEQPYKEKCKHLEYTSQDFCQYDGVGNAQGLQTSNFDTTKIDIVSDILQIPVEDSSFDAILCTEVLEHVPDPIRSIKEMTRILKPGGTLILSSPFFSISHFAPYHFYGGFNKYFYHTVLGEDHSVELCKPYGNYFEVLAQELFRVANPGFIKNNTSGRSNLFYRLSLLISIYILKAFNKREKNTSELLCYGFIVLAKKNIKN